jgi:predicted DNA-binding transcriptional regulator AlpA
MRAKVRPRGLAWTHVRRFFTHRRAVTMDEAEAVLGLDRSWIAANVDSDEVPQPERGLPWNEVAALLRRVLTPAELDAALGGADDFPPLLRVTAVQWRIPLYLLVALEHLVAFERTADPAAARLTVEAFVARHLDITLDDDVFKRLSVDPGFHDAFEFPWGEE